MDNLWIVSYKKYYRFIPEMMFEIILEEINCSTDESYPTSEIQSNLENPVSVSDIKNGKSIKYALTPADNGNDLSCSGLGHLTRLS